MLLVSNRSRALRDKYKRLLRYVMRSDTDVSRLQIKRGHAEVYVFDKKPFKRVAKYRASQNAAKKAQVGLWGACT